MTRFGSSSRGVEWIPTGRLLAEKRNTYEVKGL